MDRTMDRVIERLKDWREGLKATIAAEITILGYDNMSEHERGFIMGRKSAHEENLHTIEKTIEMMESCCVDQCL